MKLLIVCATEDEIRPFLAYRAAHLAPKKVEESILITGVGMVASTFSLTKKLKNHKYDLVLQVGVGGAFNDSLPPGEVVFIGSDQFGDMGAEDHDKYLDVFELGLFLKDEFPFREGKLANPHKPQEYKISLPAASGLTINTVSGSEKTIKMRADKYKCDVESMEGAAFHYVCLRDEVHFAQVRAISNRVTPRDKSQWKMQDAIANLNKWLIDFVNSI
jgi:futalosine hydrolase